MQSKSTFFLYRFLQALFSPLVIFYFLTRALLNVKYVATMGERLGFLPREYKQTIGGAIWFHAVSVGEVLAIASLVHRARTVYPCATIFVSTSTLAGNATAKAKLKARVFFAPIDYAFAVRRVLRTIRPSILVITETEIWPNLFRETKRTGCGLLMVNARISDRTAKRYATLHRFFGPVLRNADRILAQSEDQRERFARAGAPLDRLAVGGNLKYDFEPLGPTVALDDFFGGSKVWIAASTSADDRMAEEDAVLDAWQQLPGWKLLLAPRKPERFEQVASKLARAGLPFVRWSEMVPGAQGDILLLDTIGELRAMFPIADVVFMGGTLADRGGHNILEPAIVGKPIVVGPHMENFREIAQDFRQAGAMVEIQSASELADAVRKAAGDRELGARAKASAQARRGAADAAFRDLQEVYEQSLARYRRSLPAILLLWPWAQVWRAFRRRPPAEQGRIGATRVISVGNITVGGTGKTPMVLYVTQNLRANGFRPGILTRGHGRSSHEKQLFLEPGSSASVIHTGDEPQIYLRSNAAWLGIGSDRIETGHLLKERYHLDTIVLDDGFQQLRVARDLDIVLIDAMNPFGDCEMVPLGRLREPMSALARASAFVITRANCNRPAAGIERRLREINPGAPVFRSRVVPEEWVDAYSDERYSIEHLPFQRTVAFCGLGNPESFWGVLTELGMAPLERFEFGDHHRYTPREVQNMGRLGRALRAGALLTTEKDAVNLCESTEATVAPARVLWLRIGVEIENEEAFQKLLLG